MQTETDRTWPLPSREHAMRMNWHDLLFAHWPVDPADVNRLLPSGIRVDTFDGQAWIAVVPFHMTDVAPRGIPAIPWLSAFPELNVRTYVTLQGKPGVWFFSLDATSLVTVRAARIAFHLPYMDAMMSISKQDEWFRYSSHRTHRNESTAVLEAKYRPNGEIFHAQPGTLEYWLTARYCLYTANRSGRILRGEIDHPPWPIQNAELEIMENTMLDELSLARTDSPHLLYSKEIAVKAWTNERLN
jgi:hypothetical protein